MRSLFIVKRREGYGEKTDGYSQELTSGLFNSAKFVSHMIDRSGLHSKVVDVVDNNCIEREVVKFKPTHVFIEALWVVSEKIELLANKYKDIKWVVRIHSNTPFIANEGNAFDWLLDYAKLNFKNVIIAPNARSFQHDLGIVIDKSKIVYLPNYYQFEKKHVIFREVVGEVNIGCFGAIRPLKNQLAQALAAIAFADQIGLRLNFHINFCRVEQRGNNALKNIESLFKNSKHKLVKHSWLEHKEFLKVVGSMDINMQVSFSETFNIVSADSVSQFVPVVVSSDINWVNHDLMAIPTNTADIIAKLHKAHSHFKSTIAKNNWLALHEYNAESKLIWLRFLLA
jgi:hypothetical protein